MAENVEIYYVLADPARRCCGLVVPNAFTCLFTKSHISNFYTVSFFSLIIYSLCSSRRIQDFNGNKFFQFCPAVSEPIQQKQRIKCFFSIYQYRLFQVNVHIKHSCQSNFAVDCCCSPFFWYVIVHRMYVYYYVYDCF